MAAVAQQYNVTNLNIPGVSCPGVLITFSGVNVPPTGCGLNSSGQVSGSYSPTPGVTHAFIYSSSNGTLQDLGTLPGGTFSNGAGINDAGQVTGSGDTTKGPDPGVHAFLYSNGKMSDLGTISLPNPYNSNFSDPYSAGTAINNSGAVTGISLSSNSYDGFDAFLYSSATLTDLGNLYGFESAGFGINSSGQVAGILLAPSYGEEGTFHAMLYSNGAMQDLGTLGSDPQCPDICTLSLAQGINDAGTVVGTSQTTIGGPNHAVVWNSGAIKDISGGAGYSGAVAINASGQITGYGYFGSASVSHAFLYSAGSMTDVNSLLSSADAALYTVSYGIAINDGGQILATGYLNSSPYTQLVLLLTPATAKTITVPNVAGLTQAAASTAITGVDLVVGTVTTQSSSTVASGLVISESPVAGTKVSVGSAVSLVISSGTSQVAVPNVVGSTQAAATTAITGAGLVVGTVTTQPSSTVASGPAAGTKVNSGSAVSLVVSSGAAAVTLQLNGAPVVTSVPQGFTVTVTVKNTGNTTAGSVQEVAATLDGVAQSGTIVSAIANLAPGATGNIIISFPASASSGPFSIEGNYSAPGLSGTWSGSVRKVTVP
jgi:probable HAF family extracellular repeat protein